MVILPETPFRSIIQRLHILHVLHDHQRDLECDRVLEYPQVQTGALLELVQSVYQRIPVNVQQAQFATFSNDINPMQPQENIELIKDVPLEVTVELGRTHKSINDILDFSPGTIIELDKIAGEPIDVLVNGKNVAKGEVVVIDESFGVRVTEIIK